MIVHATAVSSVRPALYTPCCDGVLLLRTSSLLCSDFSPLHAQCLAVMCEAYAKACPGSTEVTCQAVPVAVRCSCWRDLYASLSYITATLVAQTDLLW